MLQSRREMFKTAGAAAALTAIAPKAFAQWVPNPRYPDPYVQHLDPSFAKYRLGLASVEQLYTGARWSEGPVWMGDWRCLLWSDIPNNRILRWDEETGRTTIYRKPSNNANGNTRDRQGRLVTCEHDTRRVTRTEYRRHDHGAGRQIPGQAAQLAERHRGEVGRLDLVLGPAVRNSRSLRGDHGDAGTADAHLPARPAHARADRRHARRLSPERTCVLAR